MWIGIVNICFTNLLRNSKNVVTKNDADIVMHDLKMIYYKVNVFSSKLWRRKINQTTDTLIINLFEEQKYIWYFCKKM